MNDTTVPAGDLDAQELLHLALSAMDGQREAEAIGYLKRGIALAPEDARLHYLLGALHAQLGMYERAAVEMQRATQLSPRIDMAHFQLGLLHLTAGNVEAAAQAWQALDTLEPEHPLRLFQAGMMHLVHEEYDDCIACLQEGIARNPEHESLNRDMASVIEKAGQARDESAAAADAAPQAAEPAAPHHVLLSGYRSPSGGEGGQG